MKDDYKLSSDGDTGTYHVKNISEFSGFGAIIAIVVLVAYILIVAAFRINGIIFLCGLPVIVLGIFYFFNNIFIQNITITFLSDGMSVKYLRKSFLSSGLDRDILVADIKSFEEIDYKGQSLTLYLKDGAKFRMSVGALDKANDFLKVRDHIMAIIQSTNLAGEREPIVRRDNQYEGKRGARLAIVFLVLIAPTVAGIFFFPKQHTTKDVVFAVGYLFTMLSYVVYIISLRKKGHNNE